MESGTADFVHNFRVIPWVAAGVEPAATISAKLFALEVGDVLFVKAKSERN